MSNEPTYSVIIPHYNSPALLRRCLDSIPDRKDIQVIVVDDNSSPKVVDFAHFPGNERRYTQVFYNKTGHGAGHARNIALPQAKGQWLLFADADDYFTTEAWSVIAREAQRDADIIYLGIESRDNETGESLHDRGDTYMKNLRHYATTHAQDWEYRLRFWNNTPWGKLIRRQVVTQNAIVFGETKHANDVLFSTRVAICARSVEATTDVCYCVTRCAGSLTQDASLDALSERYKVCLQKNLLLRENGFRQYEAPINAFIGAFLHFGRMGIGQWYRLSKQYHASIGKSLKWFIKLHCEK